jgi:hypothetical protein
MNQLDMHTRDKINQLHIAEMQREARNRRLLRVANSAGTSAHARLRHLMVGFVLLAATLILAATVPF